MHPREGWSEEGPREREGRENLLCILDEWEEMDGVRCEPGQTLPAVCFSPLISSPKGKRRSEQTAAVWEHGSVRERVKLTPVASA